MTQRVQQLIDRLETLSKTQQDLLASDFLVQIERINSVESTPATADISLDKNQLLWIKGSAKELAASWTEWVDSHKEGPGISDKALRRINIYD